MILIANTLLNNKKKSSFYKAAKELDIETTGSGVERVQKTTAMEEPSR